MEPGQFCFIKDEFYTIFDQEHKLMRNKEQVDGAEYGRPCFYVFKDEKNTDIFWCVPISSQVEKYARIVCHKLDKQREKGIKSPTCNTIRFGMVMGAKKAFLIQNMFPITMKYIKEIYINKLNNEIVRISKNLELDVVANAKEVLRLVQHGNPYLVFSDIAKIYNNLCAELNQQERYL
jgi:hypothetical protein